jgi:hypothetical protein
MLLDGWLPGRGFQRGGAGLLTLCVLITWVIWLHRNDRTFNRSSLHHSLAVSSIINQIFDMVQSWVAAGIVDKSHIFGV